MPDLFSFLLQPWYIYGSARGYPNDTSFFKPVLTEEFLESTKPEDATPFEVFKAWKSAWVNYKPCSEIDIHGKPVAPVGLKQVEQWKIEEPQKPKVSIACPKCGQEFMGLVKTVPEFPEFPEYPGGIPKPPYEHDHLDRIGNNYELRCGCIVSNAWAVALVDANWRMSHKKPVQTPIDYGFFDRMDRCGVLYSQFKQLIDAVDKIKTPNDKKLLDYWLVVTANRLRDLKSYGTVFQIRKELEPAVMTWVLENKLYYPSVIPIPKLVEVLPVVEEPKTLSQREVIGLTKAVTAFDLTIRKKRTIRKIIE